MQCNDIQGGVKGEGETERGEGWGVRESLGSGDRLSSAAKLHRAALVLKSPLVLKTQTPAVSMRVSICHLVSAKLPDKYTQNSS